jgi:hypothetical protein
MGAIFVQFSGIYKCTQWVYYMGVNQTTPHQERKLIMKERQYEVEVYERYSHGCYGKQHYFGWILSSDKKANAESFALEILGRMTPNELHKESDGKLRTDVYGWHKFVPTQDGKYKYVILDNDEPIGYEEAEKRFTVKARLFKG